MKQVGRMLELERLHLENTDVSDGGLAHLGRLEKLGYLNLYGTKITDAGMQALHGLNNLRKLYVWQTEVTAEGKRDFERAVNLEINIGSELAAPDGDGEEAKKPEAPAPAQNNQ